MFWKKTFTKTAKNTIIGNQGRLKGGRRRGPLNTPLETASKCLAVTRHRSGLSVLNLMPGRYHQGDQLHISASRYGRQSGPCGLQTTYHTPDDHRHDEWREAFQPSPGAVQCGKRTTIHCGRLSWTGNSSSTTLHVAVVELRALSQQRQYRYTAVLEQEAKLSLG